MNIEKCNLCPRKCNVDRKKQKGYCSSGDKIKIARYSLHMWEEPCLSGNSGSGTVFFSGCNLKCCFCQNHEISQEGKGFEISVSQLEDIFLELQQKGANNINLVTPTHFVPQIIKALDNIKNKLEIPVAYNCGGYENPQTIEMLKNYVDIFLPDLKFYSGELSLKYLNAKDYFEKAIKSIKKMQSITGSIKFDKNNILKKGTIIRHLVMPSCTGDSINILKRLSKEFDLSKENPEILLSLMFQYFPCFKAENFAEINRCVTDQEYTYVLEYVEKLGFEGYIQEKNKDESEFVPKFYSDYNKFRLENP